MVSELKRGFTSALLELSHIQHGDTHLREELEENRRSCRKKAARLELLVESLRVRRALTSRERPTAAAAAGNPLRSVLRPPRRSSGGCRPRSPSWTARGRELRRRRETPPS